LLNAGNHGGVRRGEAAPVQMGRKRLRPGLEQMDGCLLASQ